jgi:hypothetical protein
MRCLEWYRYQEMYTMLEEVTHSNVAANFGFTFFLYLFALLIVIKPIPLYNN